MNYNTLAARIYLVLGEQMPENAPDEWFLGSDPNKVTVEETESFWNALDTLLNHLYIMGDGKESSEYQTLFYDAAKRAFGDEKSSIRRFFMFLYAVVMDRDSGPRWGEFVAVVGVDHFNEIVRERVNL